MKFYRCCGDNVEVSADGSRASRRSQREFNNGVVFGDKPLAPGVAVNVRVVDVVRYRCVFVVTTFMRGENKRVRFKLACPVVSGTKNGNACISV